MSGEARMDNRKWKIVKGKSRFLASLGMTTIRLWQGLREWSGDAAYETYVQCAMRQHATQVLSREEFYV